MKILYLLFISTVVFGQAFQDSCNNFVQPASDEIAFYNFNPQYKTVSGEADILQDLANSYDLTVSGWTSAADAEDSCYISAPDYKGGTALHFDGVDAYLTSTNQDFNIGTSDYTFAFWLNIPDYSPASYIPILDKFTSANERYIVNFTSPNIVTFSRASAGGTTNLQFFTSSVAALTDGTWHHFIVTVDRATTVKVYIDGVENSTTVSANLATSLDNAGNFYIGYQPLSGSESWIKGYMSQLRFFKKYIDGVEAKRLSVLPAGWFTKNGNVVKDGWNIGITGNTLKAWVGSGTAQTIAVTSDSTRFNVNLGAVNLSTDSLYIATDTDTVFHALADSTLPDGYQWTLQIDADDRGAYVMVDNIILTANLPATETQDKGFKERKKRIERIRR